MALRTAADLLAVGLWEVVATLGEAVLSGKQVAFEVSYNEDEKIESVVTLQQQRGRSKTCNRSCAASVASAA